MKNILFALFILCAFSVAAFAQPTIPTKLFDVRNGNGVVDSGTTYPQAVVVPFKDLASANKIYDAFALAFSYQVTIPDPANPSVQIPNPQSKKQFFMRQITRFINEVYKAQQVQSAAKTAGDAAGSAVDDEVPAATAAIDVATPRSVPRRRQQ